MLRAPRSSPERRAASAIANEERLEDGAAERHSSLRFQEAQILSKLSIIGLPIAIEEQQTDARVRGREKIGAGALRDVLDLARAQPPGGIEGRVHPKEKGFHERDFHHRRGVARPGGSVEPLDELEPR